MFLAYKKEFSVIMIKLLIIVWSLLLSYSIYAHASPRTITIYGIELGRQLAEGQQQGNYILQIGAFRSQANAIDYKKRLAMKTAIPIRILSPQKNQGNFSLIAGPFKNSTAVKQLSLQLSSTVPVTKQLAVRKSLPIARKQPPRLANIKPVLLQPVHKPVTLISQSGARSSLSDKSSLIDANTQEANNIAMAMRATGKIHLGHSRQQIERKTAALQAELAAIQLRLQHETKPSTIASLEKRQGVINRELDGIMAMIITRISRK